MAQQTPTAHQSPKAHRPRLAHQLPLAHLATTQRPTTLPRENPGTPRRADLYKLLRTLVVLTPQTSIIRKRSRRTLLRPLGIQPDNKRTEHLSSRKGHAGLGDAMGVFGHTGLTIVHEMDFMKVSSSRSPKRQTSYFYPFLICRGALIFVSVPSISMSCK